MKKPGLKQLLEWAGNPDSALDGLGRRRAVIHCRRHGRRWFTLAEVRADVILAHGYRQGDLRSSYDIVVRCEACPRGDDERVIDVARVRSALATPHNGVLKLDVDKVTRPPRDTA